MSSEISVNLFNVPAGKEEEVKRLLARHDLGYLTDEDVEDETYDLYGADLENYYAGTWECEDVARELAALGVSFRLYFRSDSDGCIEYDPELGERRCEVTDEGDDAISAWSLEGLLELTTVEEIHARINEMTGKAWADKFRAYEAERGAPAWQA